MIHIKLWTYRCTLERLLVHLWKSLVSWNNNVYMALNRTPVSLSCCCFSKVHLSIYHLVNQWKIIRHKLITSNSLSKNGENLLHVNSFYDSWICLGFGVLGIQHKQKVDVILSCSHTENSILLLGTCSHDLRINLKPNRNLKVN